MTKKLLSNGAVVFDNWQIIDDTNDIKKLSELPSGRLILSLSHWHRFQAKLQDRGADKLGILLESHDSPSQISEALDLVSVVAINFQVFTDGRGYSLARELREHYNFKGEIRALGDVLIDQLYALRRCGFDAFVLRKTQDIEVANRYLATFSFPYQGAMDDPRPVWHR